MSSLTERHAAARRLIDGLATVIVVTVLFAMAPGTVRANEGAGGPPPTVRIRPLMLPVLTPEGRIERYTQVEVTLEVSDSLRLPEVQGVVPKLHDAILTALYRATDDGYIIRGAVANAPALRKMLLDAAAGVVGKDLIGRVLITPMSRQSAWP